MPSSFKDLAAHRSLREYRHYRALGLFDTADLVALTALIGYYGTVALLLNAAEREVPEGTPALPLRSLT